MPASAISLRLDSLVPQSPGDRFLLARLVGETAGFFRILRTLRLLRSYQLWSRWTAILRDHLLASVLTGKRGGPVHIIACHKSATESQAARLLGFPDATIVAPPFGIFVADLVQKVQFAFIAKCRDDANTPGLQRFFDWLSQTGEEVRLAERALARARIVRAIAAETKAR